MLNYFESPGYPQLYADRIRVLYLLYLPGVSEIRFDFDPLAFGIENNKDELHVGPGLQFVFEELTVRTPGINFFENVNATVPRGNGVLTPGSFVIQGDSAWMYFLTDKNIMFPGWRLSWTIPGK